MKVIILTEGGRGIGFGHITRCLALRAAFAKEGIPVTLVVCGDASVKKQFGTQLDLIFNWLKEPERLAQTLRHASIVIVDSYLAPIEFYKKIAKSILVPVYLDDYRRLPYPRGIVVNGSTGADKFHYPQQSGKTYLLGSRYALLRQDFWRIPRRAVRHAIREVLITLGGIDHSEFIRQLLACLLPRFPKWRFHVVKASAASDQGSGGSQVRFYSGLSAKKMRDLMLKCDVAISGGGQTTNELSACGLPTIAICFAKNQRLNIQGWEKHGFLQYAGISHDPAIFKKVEKSLRRLSFKKRCLMRRRGRALVDGQGAQQIARQLSDMCFDFPDMGGKDCRQVFYWANDPEIRSASLFSEPIKWSDHCKWFFKKLQDPQSTFYKVMWNGQPIGQVRFDEMKDGAKISLAIAKKYRGKNFGVSVIRLAAQKFFRCFRTRKINAFIKPSNVASRKAFRRAGFINCGVMTQQGQKTSHWVLCNEENK